MGLVHAQLLLVVLTLPGCGQTEFAGAGASQRTVDDRGEDAVLSPAPAADATAGTASPESHLPPPAEASLPANEPAGTPAANASLSGLALNALDKSPVAGASVRIAGREPARTDAGGAFSFASLPAGPVEVTVSAPGFASDTLTATLAAGDTVQLTFILSPSLAPGALRFVLTWGAAPADLDAHLYGPKAGGGEFHVYFDNKVTADARLDRDDTRGAGPETITVRALRDGRYRLQVVDYTNACGTSPAGGSLGASAATLKIYQADRMLGAFTVRSAAGPAVAWNAVSLDVNGDEVKITALDTYGGAAVDCQD